MGQHYGITQFGQGKFRVMVPTKVTGGYRIMDFSACLYKDPATAAIEWRDSQGTEVWGSAWEVIVALGSVRTLRGKGRGFHSAEVTLMDGNKAWVAYWFHRGETKTAMFTESDYGTLENAKDAANSHISKLKIELVGNERPASWPARVTDTLTENNTCIGWRVVWRDKGENHEKLFKWSESKTPAVSKFQAHKFARELKFKLNAKRSLPPRVQEGDWIQISEHECLVVSVIDNHNHLLACEVIYNKSIPTNRFAVFSRGRWEWESMINGGDYAEEIDRLRNYVEIFKNAQNQS